MKRFSRSEVKGQGHDPTDCYNAGCMHLDGVALRFTCFTDGFLVSVHFNFFTSIVRMHAKFTHFFS